MGKHINITNSLLLERIDILKSKYNIFQTTKLLEYLVNKEFEEKIKDSKNIDILENNSMEEKVIIKENKDETFPWLEDEFKNKKTSKIEVDRTPFKFDPDNPFA